MSRIARLRCTALHSVGSLFHTTRRATMLARAVVSKLKREIEPTEKHGSVWLMQQCAQRTRSGFPCLQGRTTGGQGQTLLCCAAATLAGTLAAPSFGAQDTSSFSLCSLLRALQLNKQPWRLLHFTCATRAPCSIRKTKLTTLMMPMSYRRVIFRRHLHIPNTMQKLL